MIISSLASVFTYVRREFFTEIKGSERKGNKKNNIERPLFTILITCQQIIMWVLIGTTEEEKVPRDVNIYLFLVTAITLFICGLLMESIFYIEIIPWSALSDTFRLRMTTLLINGRINKQLTQLKYTQNINASMK